MEKISGLAASGRVITSFGDIDHATVTAAHGLGLEGILDLVIAVVSAPCLFQHFEGGFHVIADGESGGIGQADFVGRKRVQNRIGQVR